MQGNNKNLGVGGVVESGGKEQKERGKIGVKRGVDY